MRFKILALPFIFVSCSAVAQDASLLAGGMKMQGGDSSFAVGLGYTQRYGQHLAASMEYVNEGHPGPHHRDGLSAQFWLRTPIPERGASFAVGAGPYYFFNTKGTDDHYLNEHGWGQMVNLSAKWHLHSRKYIEARLSHIHANTGHDSTMLMVGMGYELRELPRAVKDRNAGRGDNLVLLLAGRSIVNSFHSERATAAAVEYRHTLTPNAEWSATLLTEGKVGYAQRHGVAAQAWLLRPFTERTVLALGVGGYLMRDQVDRFDPNDKARTRFAPIASIGMRWRLSDDVRAQLSWSRVITDYHRDSDVFLLGAGLVF